MADKIWSADEYGRLSPEQQKAVFEACLVTDLSTAPPEFMARVRADARRIIAERDASRPN